MIDYRPTFAAVLRSVGARARELRVLRALRQEEVAQRAGVGIATVRRFEKSGLASLDSALRIAFALEADGPFSKLFEAPAYKTIDEALARPASTASRRKRVKAAK